MTPADIWLICGRSITQGCTCHPFDPTPERAQEAIRRLAIETVEVAGPGDTPLSAQPPDPHRKEVRGAP